MDVREMKLPDNTFDLVIDKGAYKLLHTVSERHILW